LFFNNLDIVVVDKSISGNEATVIARITFNLTEIPQYGSSNERALSKYFGVSSVEYKTYEQERKFLFQQYESENWRFEREIGTD
jgi:transposase-like protein